MRKITFVFPALVALALCVWPETAGAADLLRSALAPIPSIAPSDFPAPATVMLQAAASAPEAHWIWTLVGSSLFASILGALARIVQSIIANIKDARVSQACDFVFAGTMTCYQEYVRAAKAAHADGKLTADEKDEALRYAYRKAVEIARTKGVDLVKRLGKEMILAKIEEYVGGSKAAALAKAVAGPLSASSQPVPEPPLPASAY